MCARSSTTSPRAISALGLPAVRVSGKRKNASNAPRYRSFPANSDACLSYSVRHNRRILLPRTSRCAGTGSFVFYYLLIPRRRRMAKVRSSGSTQPRAMDSSSPRAAGRTFSFTFRRCRRQGFRRLTKGRRSNTKRSQTAARPRLRTSRFSTRRAHSRTRSGSGAPNISSVHCLR